MNPGEAADDLLVEEFPDEVLEKSRGAPRWITVRGLRASRAYPRAVHARLDFHVGPVIKVTYAAA